MAQSSFEFSETSIKTAPEKTAAARKHVFGERTTNSTSRSSKALLAESGGRVAWPEVLRVLQSDEARTYALNRYRSAGHTPDDFGHVRAAREAMADALTYTEDWLEMASIDHVARRAVRDAERLAIRDVRRRLEWELWP